jgi:hypothetical protein
MQWFLFRHSSQGAALRPYAGAQQDFCSRNPVNLPKRFGRKETSVKKEKERNPER